MIALLVISALSAWPQEEVSLERKFKAGERLEYSVDCSLHMEYKGSGMQFYMPQEFDVSYRFTTQVQTLLHDGFAQVVYERPSMTFTDGENASSPPRTTVEKTAWKFQLDLSPINEITKAKDLNPQRPQGKGDDKSHWNHAGPGQEVTQEGTPDPLVPMIRELRGLALFLGNLDSSLDLNPKLPLDPVKVGSTWKKTVSFQPRKLADSDRQAMQRLDMTYRYDGLVQSDGKPVHRVTAMVDLDTDAAPWLNQIFGVKPDESDLAAVKLVLKTKIEFDLEPVTLTTLRAGAESNGEISITLAQNKDTPIYTEKLKGKSAMNLVKRS
ncbi:MAG: hypothetical protein KF884_02150 [Fimbriimonadaceae bacterium]|nr:hypothetical protein [Fimbriimonadaceae bacterium]QYK58897.1 MAG: hypothetical protein KF884_02150 [Fimbriimonadaceae bacterium]